MQPPLDIGIRFQLSGMDPYTLFLLFLLSCSHPHTASSCESDVSDTKAYIIQVKHPVEEAHLDVHHPESMEVWYNSLLDNISDVTSKTTTNEPRIIHSYTHALTGFAARLTDKELEVVKKQDWFAYARPNHVYMPQTTHTPQFLGLIPDVGVWKSSNYGEGIIIGVVDYGITPGHPSFNDEGLPSPPARWKGYCEPPFVCNNKIVAAKSLVKGEPPTDATGHGTHTASIAAGSLVKNVSVGGNAAGSMVGMAPHAHLAIYKACNKDGCESMTTIAGIGAAIRDGCDVISVSLASFDNISFFDEGIYIATFSAIKRDIFISAGAANNGPLPSTLKNSAPWVLTVGSSTMDRIIGATVKLGSGLNLEGVSLYQPRDFGTEMRQLVYAGHPSNHNPNASFCKEDAFDGFDVRGKIVVCENGGGGKRVDKGKYVKNAGGVGMVLLNGKGMRYELEHDMHFLPASAVNYEDGILIKTYINSTSNPTGTILFKGTVTGTPRAPIVAYSSGRGPNLDSPGILKPDIIGPGVSIVAASPDQFEPTELFGNMSPPYFRMASGTSMACPHLSGIAALLKVAHPDWSTSAIKSAIMTTASTTDNHGGPILDHRHLPANLFAVGAGHVNVSRAHDPGLVYETQHDDYVPYLCGLGLTEQQIYSITNTTVECSYANSITDHDLNYPSIAVTVGPSRSNVSVPRIVTNVGEPNEMYWAEVDAPAGVSIVVNPRKFTINDVNSRTNFTVSFTSTGGGSGYAEGQLKWVSNMHIVRSPISIKFS